MQRLSAERVIGVGLVLSAIALVAVLALGFGSDLLTGVPTSTPSAGPVTQASATAAQASTTAAQAASPAPTATPSDSPTALTTLAPTPTPTAASSASPALPAMLATIGDSYTQAWSVSPAYKKDHPGYSWAVGNVKGDHVFSLRERFEALGDNVAVVDAATSGKKMSDAARQATEIVAAARSLAPGATVFVTFELGTNDLCDTPTTDPATFETQLRAAVDILRSGLPSGSEILMLSVPDFSHFYAITQANAEARTILSEAAHAQTCAPFLGWDSPLTIGAARQLLATYDATLGQVCGEIEATDGQAGKLHCLSNEALLSEKDFTIKDLSTVDYFHPSLSGQAKMAASAWAAGYWANVQLPPGAAALALGDAGGPGGGDFGGVAPAGIAPIVPFLLGRRRRRRLTRHPAR